MVVSVCVQCRPITPISSTANVSMATPPTEQMRRARKSGHAGAMADARQSVRVPAIYVSAANVGAPQRAYDINTANGIQRGTNMRGKSCDDDEIWCAETTLEKLRGKEEGAESQSELRA